MAILAERVVALLRRTEGLSDREITDELTGTGSPQQAVNSACRILAKDGVIARRQRSDGRIANYLTASQIAPGTAIAERPEDDRDALAEDSIKLALATYLKADGWTVEVAWGRTRGIDIDARREDDRWIIEVKGRGISDQARGNYFLGMLGELLQRMDEDRARYSVAMPDMPRFRRLWQHLPALAKQRTSITAIFVDEAGIVTEMDE